MLRYPHQREVSADGNRKPAPKLIRPVSLVEGAVEGFIWRTPLCLGAAGRDLSTRQQQTPIAVPAIGLVVACRLFGAVGTLRPLAALVYPTVVFVSRKKFIAFKANGSTPGLPNS